MLFPAEHAAFATEFIADVFVANNPRSLTSACGPFDGSPLAERIESYCIVGGLDFMVTGHGSMAVDKTLMRDTRELLGHLRDEVSAGMAAGPSLEELKERARLEPYKDWANHERLREHNVEAAYRNLLTYR
jgi:hypothetical protein